MMTSDEHNELQKELVEFLSFFAVHNDDALSQSYLLPLEIQYEVLDGAVTSDNALMLLCLDFLSYFSSNWENIEESFEENVFLRVEEIVDILNLDSSRDFYDLSNENNLNRPAWRVIRELAKRALQDLDPNISISLPDVKQWMNSYFTGFKP